MSNKLTISEKKILACYRTGKPKEEIFDSITAHAHEHYEGKITDQEAKRLARNFIMLCEKMINVQIRLEKEREKTGELTF